MKIEFFIEGEPVGKPRSHTAKGRTFYKEGPWTRWVAQATLQMRKKAPSEPLLGPLVVTVVAYFTLPQKPSKELRARIKECGDSLVPHTSTPDRDNVDKAVLDLLQKLGFMKNDSQVFHGGVRKFYAHHESPPGCLVIIEGWP